MVRFHAALKEGVEAGSASLRVGPRNLSTPPDEPSTKNNRRRLWERLLASRPSSLLTACRQVSSDPERETDANASERLGLTLTPVRASVAVAGRDARISEWWGLSHEN